MTHSVPTTPQPWQIGDWVEFIRGRAKGQKGAVFYCEWSVRQFDGDGERIAENWRVGVQNNEGDKFWGNADHVRRVKKEPPKVKKGSRVTWVDKKAGKSGQGSVFWHGMGKYGGMRVGLKDDASGDTVWLGIEDVKPLTEDGLADLRTLLYDEPSPELWKKVWELFEGWPGGDPMLPIGIAYAQEHLASWPDELRVLPKKWQQRLLNGGTRAADAIVRKASFRRNGVPSNYMKVFNKMLGSDLTDLRIVDFSSHYLGPERLADLQAWHALKTVVDLDLAENRLGDDGVVLIAENDAWPELKRLSLRKCYFGWRGAIALSKAPHLARLSALDLGDNEIARPGIKALVTSPHLCRDIKISLAETATTKDLKSIAKDIGLKGYSKLKKAELAVAVVDAPPQDTD